MQNGLFGTSRVAENVFALTMTKGQGTPLYMAPEMLGGHRHYTKAVGVYSYGVLGSVVWDDGQQPYAEQRFRSPLDLQNAVLAGCRPQPPTDCPMLEIIRQCWSPNPADRPSTPSAGRSDDRFDRRGLKGFSSERVVHK